jgi:DNA-binding NarL/FixJ family response regulator
MGRQQDTDSRGQWMHAATLATSAPLAVGIEQLTAGQQRMLRLLVSGATVADLAAHLGLSVGLARREQRLVLSTLGVGSAQEAALLWWGSRAGARADLRAVVERRLVVAPSPGSAAA